MGTEKQANQKETEKILKRYSSIHDLPFDGYISLICDEANAPEVESIEKIQEEFI